MMAVINEEAFSHALFLVEAITFGRKLKLQL